MPDFLINAADRVVGVEHREVLKPTRGAAVPERAHERNADDVLAMAREFSELRGLPYAQVSVLFGRSVPATRGTRLKLARKLEQVVHDFMPGDRGNIRLGFEHLAARQIYGIDAVYIHRDDRLYGRWIAPRAGWVMADCIELLQTAIEGKALKYPAYRKHCAECWLLLVADSRKPSASIHPSAESLAYEYSSPFEKTFFLDYGMGQLHELRRKPE